MPNYNVMGVAKAALEASRALSRRRSGPRRHPRQRDFGRADAHAGGFGRGRRAPCLQMEQGAFARSRKTSSSTMWAARHSICLAICRQASPAKSISSTPATMSIGMPPTADLKGWVAPENGKSREINSHVWLSATLATSEWRNTRLSRNGTIMRALLAAIPAWAGDARFGAVMAGRDLVLRPPAAGRLRRSQPKARRGRTGREPRRSSRHPCGSRGAHGDVSERELIGTWRCRTMKLGGISPAVVYSWFRCRMRHTRNGLFFEKLTRHAALLRLSRPLQ